MNYYILPNCYIAQNPRVASQSLAMAIMQTYYPYFCKDFTNSAEYWHACPITDAPDKDKPIYMLVRDPIERFISAVSMSETTLADAINELETIKDEHFTPQSKEITQDIQKFKFPDDLEAFCLISGLPYPLPKSNEALKEKEIPSKEQIQILKEFYSDDIEIYKEL